MDVDRFVMLGPPGSGKGTQARRLAARRAVPHISVGALLRAEIAAGSDLGVGIAHLVEAGALVGDEIIVDVLRESLGDAAGGWVLDGAPRTIEQAQLLAPLIEAPSGEGAGNEERRRRGALVIALEVSEDEIRSRLVERAVREDRTDDTPAVIEHRIETWAETAPPLLAWYAARGMLVTVDAMGDIDEVAARIEAVIP